MYIVKICYMISKHICVSMYSYVTQINYKLKFFIERKSTLMTPDLKIG